MAAKGPSSHIRKTPLKPFAKPQNLRGIGGIANIAGESVKGFFTHTPPRFRHFPAELTAARPLYPGSIRNTLKTPPKPIRGCIHASP